MDRRRITDINQTVFLVIEDSLDVISTMRVKFEQCGIPEKNIRFIQNGEEFMEGFHRMMSYYQKQNKELAVFLDGHVLPDVDGADILSFIEGYFEGDDDEDPVDFNAFVTISISGEGDFRLRRHGVVVPTDGVLNKRNFNKDDLYLALGLHGYDCSD